METHLRKHLVHGVFLLVMVLAVRASDLQLGTLALVGIVVASIAMLDTGLWLIRRRHTATEAT